LLSALFLQKQILEWKTGAALLLVRFGLGLVTRQEIVKTTG